MIITDSPEATIAFGRELGKELKGNEVIALYGELGAGKTTLIKGIVQGLGIEKEVKSPSFVIITEYQSGEKIVYHIDLYRIVSQKEVEGIGLADYLIAPGVKLIEWAEKIEEFLPPETKRITIKVISKERREIQIA